MTEYCIKCKKPVLTVKNSVDIGIAEIWNNHCSECGNFISSGIIVEEFKDNEIQKRSNNGN